MTSSPRLYVRASQPQIPSQPETAGWCIELHIPAITAETEVSRSSSVASESRHKQKHGFFSGFKSKRQHAPSQPQSITPPPESADEQRSFFSLSRNDLLRTSEPVDDAIMRILLPPLMSSALTSWDLSSTIERILRHLDTSSQSTPNSAAWLNSALCLLQSEKILPSQAESAKSLKGLDIEKFLYFAQSRLEIRARAAQIEQVKFVEEIDYDVARRENARLKRMLSSHGQLGFGAEDDEPTLHSGTSTSKKGWGGFWVTHGSTYAARSSSSCGYSPSSCLRRSDPYGGLM